MSNMTDYQVYQDQVNEVLAQARMQLEDQPILMRYCVVVALPNRTWGVGQAVTHLSLDDWANLHKYQILSIGEVRRALPNEKTDLFQESSTALHRMGLLPNRLTGP